MQLWAIILDGFREALDRKIFWVLIGLSTMIALAMISISFEEDKITFFFGMADAETGRFNPLSALGRSNVVGLVVYFLLDALLAWVGIVLMVVATAGMFPNFLRHGGVDVVLSKPITRSRLFLYKYLAGLVFVFVQAGYFVVMTFLVMGLRWGVWSPGYLLAAPLLVLLFSYIFCISVLVGVKTRSTVAAVLLTVGAWMLSAMVTQAPQMFEVMPSLKNNTRIYTAIRVLSWIPPKTADFPYVAAKWAGAGTSSDVLPMDFAKTPGGPSSDDLRRAKEIELRELEKNPFYSIGSSLLFEAVILLLAMRTFVRRDY